MSPGATNEPHSTTQSHADTEEETNKTTTSTSNATVEIRPLPADAVRRIVAGQAVSDLASAVKELVDNALDAGSKNINIRLFNQGADIIEVSDDGCGVPLASRPLLATAHATSKIASWEDIYRDINIPKPTTVTTTSSSGSSSSSGGSSSTTTAHNTKTPATTTSLSSSSAAAATIKTTATTTNATMGFRGEALFCLANLSAKLVVATRCADQDMAQKLEFGRDGQLLLSWPPPPPPPPSGGTTTTTTTSAAAVADMVRKVGTTVAVVRFLDAVPVRRADMKRTIHQQRGKLFRWMQAYAIFSVGVRIRLMDMVMVKNHNNNNNKGDDCREQIALQTTADSTTLRETISSVLGSNFLSTLAPVTIDLSNVLVLGGQQKKDESGCGDKEVVVVDVNDQTVFPEEESIQKNRSSPLLSSSCSSPWNIDGWIVRAGPATSSSASSNNNNNKVHRPVQYFCINGRPVDLPMVTKMLNELWKSFGQVSKKPSCILRFNLPAASYDINLSPDKRQVLLTHETEILEAIREHVSQMWASQSNGRFAMNKILLLAQPMEAAASAGQRKDAGEVRNGEEEPGMFNRRYAFSHDFSKAKLQHEYHDGRVKRSRSFTPPGTSQGLDEFAAGAAPKQTVIEGDTKSTKVIESSSTSESSRRKRLRVDISAEPQSNMSMVTPSPAKIDATLPTPSESSLVPSGVKDTAAGTTFKDPESASVAEHHQWHKVQASFRQNFTGDDDDIEQEIASITQRRHETDNNNNAANTSDLSRHQDPKGSNATGATSTTSDFKKCCLDQFVFRAIKSTATRQGQANTTSCAEPETDLATGGATLSSNARRVSDVRGDSAHSRPGEPPCENTEPVTAKVCAIEQVESTPPPPQEAKYESRQNSEPRRTSVERAPETVTWASFQGTNQVISRSRLHRLALLERKRKYHEQRHTVPTHHDTVHLTKADFKDSITVLGQFNMGFILAKTRDNHLWIFDQHACDERYNFEKLAAETVIKEQPLIAPLPLELSPAEELCVRDNLEIFQKNGFRFAIDETKPPRHRISLVAVPVSGAADGRKAVQFGRDDVSALCSVMGVDGSAPDAVDGGTGTDGSGMYGNNAVRRYAAGSTTTGPASGDTADRILARLPKAIAMFASRACRSSVMIGTPLSELEMERIVQRLGDLENPWHCAHGRTTVNHVGDLGQLMAQDERKASAHVAGPTVTVMSQMEDTEED